MRTHALLIIFPNKDDIAEYPLTFLVHKMHLLFEEINVFTFENVPDHYLQ